MATGTGERLPSLPNDETGHQGRPPRSGMPPRVRWDLRPQRAMRALDQASTATPPPLVSSKTLRKSSRRADLKVSAMTIRGIGRSPGIVLERPVGPPMDREGNHIKEGGGWPAFRPPRHGSEAHLCCRDILHGHHGHLVGHQVAATLPCPARVEAPPEGPEQASAVATQGACAVGPGATLRRMARAPPVSSWRARTAAGPGRVPEMEVKAMERWRDMVALVDRATHKPLLNTSCHSIPGSV